MAEKKQRLFDLPETKGAFQLKGVVSGTDKDGFYNEKKTKTGKDMRTINFGVSYDDNETLYINKTGIAQSKVYFSKKAEEKGGKSTTEAVDWDNRFSYNREGFKLIGNNIGVRKKIDEKGKEVNDKKVLTDFDACKEIGDNLKDGASVFIRGNIDYSSFINDKGDKRVSIKLDPNQVSLCSDIDFKADGYEKQNNFNQVIIFVGIDKEKDSNDKETGRFVVSAKIVTYSTIEDVEYIITDSKLANLFKKNLKPYNAIKVNGDIVSSKQVEEVSEEDAWGETDKMNKVSNPTKREFIIKGATPSTIDKELYTEEKVQEAIAKINNANKAENDFGSSSTSDWGEVSDDDDEEVW